MPFLSRYHRLIKKDIGRFQMLYFTYILTGCVRGLLCINKYQKIFGTFIVSNFSSADVDKDLALCLSFKLYIAS